MTISLPYLCLLHIVVNDWDVLEVLSRIHYPNLCILSMDVSASTFTRPLVHPYQPLFMFLASSNHDLALFQFHSVLEHPHDFLPDLFQTCQLREIASLEVIFKLEEWPPTLAVLDAVAKVDRSHRGSLPLYNYIWNKDSSYEYMGWVHPCIFALLLRYEAEMNLVGIHPNLLLMAA